MTDWSSVLVPTATVALFGAFSYLSYIRRLGTVMASQIIWSHKIEDAGDLLRNTFDISKPVPGPGFEKMLATKPLYLRADQGELYFEMRIVKIRVETHLNSNKNRLFPAGFALEQCSDKSEIFNIPPTAINPSYSGPAKLIGRRYDYRITRGKLIKPGEYILKAFLPYDLLGQPGVDIELCAISGRPPLNGYILGALGFIFAACIAALFFLHRS